MNFLRFLGENSSVNYASGTPSFVVAVIDPVFEILGWLLPVIMILIGLVGVIYSIVLGLNFAKAESSDQRDAAKKKLISVVIGVLVIIIAILLVFIFIKQAPNIFDWVSKSAGNSST